MNMKLEIEVFDHMMLWMSYCVHNDHVGY